MAGEHDDVNRVSFEDSVDVPAGPANERLQLLRGNEEVIEPG